MQENIKNILAKSLSENKIIEIAGPINFNSTDQKWQLGMDDFLYFTAKKEDKKITLKVTDRALVKFGSRDLTYGDHLKNEFDVFQFISRKLPSSLKCRLVKIYQVIKVTDNISVTILENLIGEAYLGKQKDAEIDINLTSTWFEFLPETLVYFNNLQKANFPDFIRNYPNNLKEADASMKIHLLDLRREFIKYELDLNLCDKLLSLWSKLPVEIAFQKHDLVPWRTFKKADEYIMHSNHWAGFQSRYYDVIYLMIKLWTHVDNKKLAQVWLQVFFKTLEAEKQKHFTKQIFKPATQRIIHDLIEYRNHENYEEVVDLAQRISTGDFEQLIQ